MKANMLVTDDGHSTIVIVDDTGKPSIVTETHPNYLRIADAVRNKQDPTPFLEVTPAVIDHVVENLSARVSVVDGVLHFDGDPIYNGVADTILRYHGEGRDATNVVRFMERLSTNPSENSRAQLFTWTQAQDLTIDVDGYIIGYKGVKARDNDQDYLDTDGLPIFPLDRYPYASTSKGHGIVDGHEINGHLPMGVGVVVEMPRAEVTDDPNEGCSTGLHVGDYDYAVGYAHAGALLEVRFDPADVVSVPADCNFSKLRCCRYSGAAIHELEAGDDLSDYEPEAEFDNDEAWAEFALEVPNEGWVSRLRNRVRRKNKVQDEEEGQV